VFEFQKGEKFFSFPKPPYFLFSGYGVLSRD